MLAFALAALVALLCVASIALAAPTFPPLTGRVVDQANILSPQAEAALSARLEALERDTHRQLVVVTLPSLQGYEIEEYGYQLGRAWGIGREREDDGALLIVAPNERKVRIEVGYGLEGILTDALSSVILSERVLPRFRDGDLEGGVVSGADALIEQLSLPADEAARRVAASSAQERRGESIVPILIALFFIFLIAPAMFGAIGGRGRRRPGLWPAPIIIYPGSRRGRDSGGFGGGGFSGGGGSFGGGGASGSW